MASELFAETQYFYRKQSFCLISQMLKITEDYIRPKLEKHAVQTPLFDAAAAALPLDLGRETDRP